MYGRFDSRLYFQVAFRRVLWTFCCLLSVVTRGACCSHFHFNLYHLYTRPMALDGQIQPISIPGIEALQVDEVFTLTELS